MNSPICIIPSEAAPRSRALLAAALAAACFWTGCGGSKPEPGESKPLPGLASQAEQDAENGQGNVSFHYSNKSTDANMTIDLGETDIYLEMTGRPNPPPATESKPPREPEERPPAPRAKEPEPEETPPPERETRKAMRPSMPAPLRPAAQEPKPEPPQDDDGDYEDVTAKVLTGIRKAQELFYQKRYPEAMQAVRSSLDARSTAEGHALAGSVHYMLGQGGMARREWMEALRLNPDMPSVVNMLERTRTPGGRGSPSPRPIQMRPAMRATAPLPAMDEAPYPEEYSGGLFSAPTAPAPAPAPPVPAPAASPEAEPAQPVGPAPATPPAPTVQIPAGSVPAQPAAADAPKAEAGQPAKPAPAKAAPAKAEGKRK